MAGDPVTVTDANAATKLTKAAALGRARTACARPSGPAETKIRGFGGKVLGNYQEAYNGIKVQIAGNKVNSLRSIPNVVGVHQLQTFKPDNVHGVPLIGAPAVWDGLSGFHGEGVKVAVIDTGIDYTHADFGGPGTVAAYEAALATDTAPADPTLFGPDAPKVKGGFDFVGDNYNANDPKSVPVPDSNPLDCAGHGTHVAGTAVGFGVLSDGSTYHGAYNAADGQRPQLDRRPGRRAQGGPLLAARLRLRGLDQRRHRRHRVGRRPRHGRHQHVPRFAVGHRRMTPAPSLPTTRPRTASSSWRRPATRTRFRTRRAPRRPEAT